MKADIGKPARRGDVFVFSAKVPQVSTRGDRLRHSIQYPVAIVTGGSREGRVTAYRLAGDSVVNKSRPPGILLVSAVLLDVTALERAYVARGEPKDRAFRTVEKAREFMRPYLRNSA